MCFCDETLQKLCLVVGCLLEDDDIGTRTTVGTDVKKMLKVIIVVGSIEDGDTVDLGGNVEEASAIAIMSDGCEDMLHFLPIDGCFWLAIFVGSACLHFDKV